MSALPGVGAATAERLARLGAPTVGDLLYLFPRRHLDYSRRVPVSQLQPDTVQTVIGVLWEASERPTGKRPSTEAVIGDETGNVRAIWFNQPYVARSLAGKVQARIAISGKVTLYRSRPVFESPEYELLEADDEELIHTGRLVPVYPRTEGLTARVVRRAVLLALDACAAAAPDPLPEDLRARRRLLPLPRALRGYHYPENAEALEVARRRLAFDELLVVQLGVEQRRQTRQGEPGRAIPLDSTVLNGFLGTLPFALTGAQRAALDDILGDLQRSQPMNRLVQGDVGSGKTVVAAAAMILAVAGGMQAAIMAPTELLAEQHYRSLTGLLERGGPVEVNGYLPSYLEGRGRPAQVGLLIGSRTAREKADLRERIAGGQIDLVIGTHALIQESVAFANLGLIVVDEQHRFGVAQRWSLRQKGYHPHV
ncbi:MAG: DEAD/DEAH box helicase, partial [Chloroflexi bacterium]|nr:DEAD/DEAH box helicase [Chloroflexota bacterium]